MTASLPRVLLLDNAVRHYAWGSVTAIPELLGVAPSGRPVAELWMGAHPDEPSRWSGHPDRPGLDAVIEADPEQLLGRETVARFGPRLPFLLKVLAADKALSLQVHPDSKQARDGYAAEQAAGLAADDPARNYRDAHHKPELACALTDFDAFCGFRPVEQTLRFIDALGVAQLAPYRDLLAGRDGVRATFTTLLTLPAEPRERLVAAAAEGYRRLGAGDGEWAATARACALAADDFPGDIGAVLALLLNYVRLAPGEAIFLAAGNVHAYLRGTCVEILANSDNVLRCGLTPKHIDVPELLRIADFATLAEPRWRPTGTAGAQVFAVPVPDFRLTAVRLGGEPVLLEPGLPHIVVCTDGAAELSGGDAPVELGSGSAAFVRAAAGAPSVALTGTGQAFVASPGLA